MKHVAACLLWLISASTSISTCSAQTCDVALNTGPRWLNTDCYDPARPYCVAGSCYACNPYLGGDYVCDCPTGTYCADDLATYQAGTCVAPPKYGDPCDTDQGCVTRWGQSTTYFGVDLVCVSGECRMCDPADVHQSTPYTCEYGVLNGTVRACVEPGVWATPGTSLVSCACSTLGEVLLSLCAMVAALYLIQIWVLY